MSSNKKTIQEIEQEKSAKIMRVVADRCSYYRENPHRFAEEVLGVHLKLFQKILLYEMFHNNYVMYLAARGQGKTWLTALFCICKCILYPGTKIVVCSGTLKQANEVLLKIQDDFMKNSAILRTEIEKCNIGQNDATISFYSGSWIKTRTSTDNSRSARATIIICDEFRMIDKNVLDTVIRKFLADPRHPNYLNKKEYAHLQERNQEIYMSSCYWKDSWAYEKAQSYTLNFFNDKKRYFIVGLPYQVSIMENLLMRSQVEDEMSEQDFNDIAWSMEMECLWWGDEQGSFFKFNDFNKMRKLENCLYPVKFYTENYSIPEYPKNGKRILSIDVALMASNTKKKNDAAALFLNDLERTSETTYKSNIIFGKTYEGLTTDELALKVLRYFYRYGCTDIVLDAAGSGLGIFDGIIKNIYDPEYGEEYKGLSCCNDEDMAVRCKIQDAQKVIWSVKASAKFNSQICIALRNAIQNGKINFLQNEMYADAYLTKNYKKYKELSLSEQIELKTGYINTTMLGYELVKLKTNIVNGEVRVKEESGMRKDRYSSVAYNYWCATQLEQQLKPKYRDTQKLIDKLSARIQRARY